MTNPIEWDAAAPVAVRSRLLSTTLVFVPWAIVVAFGLLHHEFWRDEVRAFSLALRGESLLSIPGVVRGEGHPFLWYFLLRAAHDLVGSVLVLPGASVLVAAAAVLLFLLRAPFPLWLRCLFVFGGLPLYEYSVMARNYGISMLLMFVFADAYTRKRRSPLLLGAILFLLANTNVHSAALVPLLVLVWASDWWAERGDARTPRESGRALLLGGALALAGIVVCFLSVFPPAHDLTAAHRVDRRSWTGALIAVFLNPGSVFGFELDGSSLPPAARSWVVIATTALLYAATFGLLARPRLFLAAVLGLWLQVLLFVKVYPGSYRHQGLWIVYLVTLYWLAVLRPAAHVPVLPRSRGALERLGGRVALPALLALNVYVGWSRIGFDAAHELSAVPALADALRATPGLDRAVVIAEPDHFLEALPYYAGNPTYLTREGKFGDTTTWTRRARVDLRLADLLAEARDLRARTGRAIVILVGPELDTLCARANQTTYSFGWTFRCDPDELREFRDATRLLAPRRGALREDFDAYLLE